MGTLLTAVLGAIVGSLLTLLGVFHSARQQRLANRTKVATEAALEHFRAAREYAKEHGGTLLPPNAYLVYYFQLYKIAEEKTLTLESLAEINDRHPGLAEALLGKK